VLNVEAEPFLPLPMARAAIPVATEFRSTWLTTSVRALRERNRLNDYLANLPKEFHAPVLDSVAGVWLPVRVAMAHYQAIDDLHLPVTEQLDIGIEVTRGVHGTVLGTIVRLAKGAGVSPWTAFSNLQRLWDRVWIGGAVGVWKLGPKEARLETIAWPPARIPYVRIGMKGVISGLTELFCKRAYVHDIPRLSTPTSLAYRVQWA
jgi:hypothetical protein